MTEEIKDDATTNTDFLEDHLDKILVYLPDYEVSVLLKHLEKYKEIFLSNHRSKIYDHL